MIRLNKETIPFQEDNIVFYACMYTYDNTLAIVCNTEYGEPYATISVNLGDYGYNLDNYWINLNHSLTKDLRDLAIKELAEEDTITPIKYGFVNSFRFKIKDKYIRIIEECEEEIE